MKLSDAFSAFIREKNSLAYSRETITYYSLHIINFIEWCNDIKFISDVREISKQLFEEYSLFLIEKNTHLKRVSIQTYLRAVKVFINWINNNLLDDDIGKLSLIKAETTNIVPLSDAEVKVVLSCFDNSLLGLRNKLICLLMLDSGLRRGEIVSLQTKDIYLSNNTMLVLGKGNKERIVPFGEETKRHLIRYINHRKKNEKVFFLCNDGSPITNNTIKMMFQDLKDTTQISRLHAHLLRHTFATNYILYGGDVEELRILLGHTSIMMTQKYVHLAAQQRILNQRYHSHIDKLVCEYKDLVINA